MRCKASAVIKMSEGTQTQPNKQTVCCSNTSLFDTGGNTKHPAVLALIDVWLTLTCHSVVTRHDAASDKQQDILSILLYIIILLLFLLHCSD